MTKTQQRYIDFIDEVADITKDFEIIDKNIGIQKAKEIREQKLYVPIIGGFSSGKSTLINRFLGDDKDSILSTNITPETALATEIHYSDDNFYEAIKSDGNIDRYNIEEKDKITQNASNYEFLRLYLKREILRDVSPSILVDMPGFESPIKQHNDAIIAYLSKGVFFVILNDMKSGDITKSIEREIDNIVEIAKGWTFFLTKTDLGTPSEVEAVKNRIKEHLSDRYDYDGEIYITTNTIENGGKELESALKDINPEFLFKKLFEAEVINHKDNIKSSLKTQVDTLTSSKDEIKNMQKELEQGIESIKKSKQEVIDNAQKRFSQDDVQIIVNNVGDELRKNASNLAMLIKNNQTAYKQEVNSIIRHATLTGLNSVLADLSEYITREFKDSICSININPDTPNASSSALFDIVSLVSSNMKTLKIPLILAKIPIVFSKVGFIIFAALEALVLPFFKAKNLQSNLEEKFINEVIPQVKASLRSELPAIFNAQIKEITQNIANKFEEKIKQKESEVAFSLKEQESKANKIDTLVVSLNEAIAKIDALSDKTFR